MEGVLFNIKRYAIHDGPGIRVTFFMKGCPLSCWWCHNPEGISPRIETVKRTDRIGDKEFEVNEELGKSYSIGELMEVVEKERVFIEESGGGVTFSGGEPLMQYEFLRAALGMFREEGIHTCIDTSGQADKRIIDSVLPLTDLFLFDIKHLDGEKHRRYTGLPNKQILSSYSRILKSGTDVIVRIPVIPGINDDPDHLEMVKDFLHDRGGDNLKRIDLLPYHKIGSSKYRRFGLEYRMEGVDQPSVSRMKELKAFYEEAGFKVKIGG